MKCNQMTLCLFFFIVFALSSVVISEDVHAIAAKTGEVDTQTSLNVRSGPSTSHEVVGWLTPGEQVEYTDNGDGWGELVDGSGYISLHYITNHDGEPVDRSSAKHDSVPPNNERIVLDPGHGGKDSGAVANGLMEKDIVLDISKRTRDILENAGFTVLMTRDEDVFVSLEERTAMANDWGADQFISIHANGFSDPAANGVETYYFPGSAAGKHMAANVQNQLVENTDRTDRGIFEKAFYVIYHTAMPAILVETGFVSNADDASQLADANYRQTVAEAIANSVIDG